ncbi:MAG TPA: hypothetical protein P5293_06345 [Bacteroidales bacterium]|nr:hypothetical protein [Bacteroidales bacterium]
MTKNIIRNFRGRNWILVEWRCCGNLWELILTPMFPDRKYWNLVCLKCG